MQRFVPIEDLFKGRQFDGQIIILCVAWYKSFKLSLWDLVIMMGGPQHLRDAYYDYRPAGESWRQEPAALPVAKNARYRAFAGCA